jgi:AraC family transcriptional regulator
MTVRVVDGFPGIAVLEVHCPTGEYGHAAADAFALRLVRRGRSPVRMDLGAGPFEQRTRPGDLLFNPAGVATRFAPATPRDMLVVSFADWLVRPLLAERGADPVDLTPLLSAPLRDDLLASVCLALCEEAHNGGLRGAAFAEAAVVAAVSTLLHLAGPGARPAPRSPDLTRLEIARCLEFIEAHLDGPLPLAQLAGSIGMERHTFVRAFRSATGQTPHRYILGRRAERAVKLLRTGKLPLAEVALAAGFAHQSHMTNVLSRLYGTTPARIRAGALGG